MYFLSAAVLSFTSELRVSRVSLKEPISFFISFRISSLSLTGDNAAADVVLNVVYALALNHFNNSISSDCTSFYDSYSFI